MPIRSLPKVHNLLIRSHKLTIFLTLPPNTTIAQVKEEALSALVSDVNIEHAEIDGTPTVSTANDFELCRLVREKDRERQGLEPTHELLDTRRSLRDYGFTSWESLFFRFKREDGELSPVTAILPSIEDEDIEVISPSIDAMSEDAPPFSSSNKGKRKAHPEEDG